MDHWSSGYAVAEEHRRVVFSCVVHDASVTSQEVKDSTADHLMWRVAAQAECSLYFLSQTK